MVFTRVDRQRPIPTRVIPGRNVGVHADLRRHKAGDSRFCEQGVESRSARVPHGANRPCATGRRDTFPPSTAHLSVKHRSAFLWPLLLIVTGCASEEAHHPIGRSVTRTKTEPDVYQVADSDVQMERATRRAQRTVGKFIAALDHPSPTEKGFLVKKLFVVDGVPEHMWLTDVHYHGGRFYGNLDNQPEKIRGPRLGQRESVIPDEISDWLYVDNGQLIGGYTLRVLADDMSPEQRAQFEKEAKFSIGR